MTTSQETGMIDEGRIAADIEAIAAFSESPPEVGYSRPTFSEPWRRARDYVIAQAEKAGAEHRIDSAGNVHIRHASLGWTRRVWLSGSHIDSVPSGGKYDGVMGVVVPLEIIRCRPDLPLELVIFAEEEGTTFELGLLGSRAWAGVIGSDLLGSLKNRFGQSYLEAGRQAGVDPSRLSRDGVVPTGPHPDDEAPFRLDPSRYAGLVEVHAEQGLSLWDSRTPIAAVRRINGRRQYDLTIAGQANHAGSTGMEGRRDALAGAAELVVSLEALGKRLDRELPYTVLTVGSLEVSPNAVNVIPGMVRLSIDFRAQEEELLERGEREIRHLAEETASKRRLEATTKRSERIEPSPLDEGICRSLQDSAKALGVEIPIVPSGALHDAAVLSPLIPTAMIFVASRDGVSHNPEEYSRSEDIALAARTLAGTIASFPGGIGAQKEAEDGGR